MLTMISSMKSAFLPSTSTSGSIAGGLLTTFIDVVKTLTVELVSLGPVFLDMGKEFFGMLVRMFKEYPIATALGGLFIAGGPILSIITGFGGMLVDFIKGIFSGGGAVPAALSSTASDMRTATDAIGSPGGGGGEGSGVAGATTAMAERSNGMMEALAVVVKAAGTAATYTAIAYGIKTISSAVRDAIELFIKPGADGKSFVDYVGDAANKLSGVSGAGLLILGGILGAIMLAVGGVIAAVGFAISKMPVGAVGVVLAGMGAVAAIKAYLGPGAKKEKDETEGTSTIKSLLTSTRALIFGIVDIISGDDFKVAIGKAAEVGTSMAGKIEGLTTMGGVLMAVGKVVTSIGTAMSAFDGIPGGIFEAPKIAKMKSLVFQMSRLFTKSDMGLGVQSGIQDMLTDIPNFDAGGLESRANDLVSIPKVISTISGVAKSIGAISITSSSIANMKRTMSTALKLFSGEGNDATKKSIQDILSDVPNVDASSMQQKIESMKSIATSIEALSGVLMKLGAMDVAKQDLAAKSMARMSEGNGPIAWLSWTFAPAAQNPNGLMALSLLSYNNLGENISFDGVFGPLSTYLDGAEVLSERLAGYKLGQFTDRLKAITGHVTSIREIMENLDTIPLDATLDAMSNNMNVAKTTMSVNGGAVVVKVAMTVNMNAQKMSEELVMKGFVMPADDFKSFLTTTDGVDDFFDTEKFISSNKLVRSSRGAETGEFKK